jgi:hypothetical protein
MKRRACHLELKFGYEGERSLADVRANGEVAPLPGIRRDSDSTEKIGICGHSPIRHGYPLSRTTGSPCY